MATDYRKFTITSIPDPSSGGGFSIPDYERDMKAIVNQAVKSALSEGGYFKTSSRVVDKRTGETRLDVYVHSGDANVVSDSLRTELGKLTYKDNFGRPTQDPKYALTSSSPTKREVRALSKEEERGDTEITRFNKSAWLKVVGLLTSIAGITRRILSSVIAFSTQTVKDMVTAHNLGMGYESVRNYRHVETAHGMKEGTITEAVAGEQQKYGNITSLDEKSLEYIALIMGNKVADMATMGLGASNPEAIVEAIVDRANELANQGINSVGQYVGEQQARRELYSYLLKYSPQIADIFATMQEEQHNINSLFRNQAETFEEWKNVLSTSRGNHIPAEYNVATTAGQQWNVVKDIYSQIKEGIALNLAPELVALLRRIANIRVGMSDRESKALDEKNKALNQQFIDSAKVQLATLGDTEADKQRALALKYYIKELEEENSKKDKIANLVPTSDEIVVKGQDLAETAIRFRVAGGKEGYSPEMKYVVDTYLDEAKRNEFFSKYRQDRMSKVRKDANSKVKEIEKARKDEFNRQAYAMVDTKGSPYYASKANIVDYDNALAMAQVELMYADEMKSKGEYEEWSKLKSIYKKKAWAIAHGYAGYYANDKVKSVAHAIIPEGTFKLSDAEINVLYKGLMGQEGNVTEEELYEALYDKYRNILAGHLANELIYQSKEKAKEGTPAYDLDVLQRTYGSDLAGLANKIGTGKGSIISSATMNANGLITHRIVFDLNNNGEVEASDIPLMSYTTNRISDVNRITDVEISNGKVNTVRTSASVQASK